MQSERSWDTKIWREPGRGEVGRSSAMVARSREARSAGLEEASDADPDRNSPGSRSRQPYTSSAAVHPMSSFRDDLMPRRTTGSLSDQAGASSSVRRAALS